MRVLVQFGQGMAARIESEVPGVEAVAVPLDGDPGDVSGDVVLTLPWGAPNLPDLLARGVRWVHVLGTGVDGFPFSVLPDDAVLTCSRGATSPPIAEWVLAVLLAFEKRLPETWVTEPVEQWSVASLGTLEGRTIGFVGLGTISRAVIARARPFGARFVAVRRTQAATPEADVEIASTLHELLGVSDHVVVAAPATPTTRHLLDDDAFRAMKEGSHLVNVSRGSLVDHEALRRTLDDGPLAMASLDVCEPEPPPPGHWLYSHPGVRLSPHVSWCAPGAIGRLLDTFVDNVRRQVEGRELTGVVDVHAGY